MAPKNLTELSESALRALAQKQEALLQVTRAMIETRAEASAHHEAFAATKTPVPS